jgi:uncharacterized protein with GYD domain
LLSAYVTIGQYDVVITVEMANGETMLKFVTGIAASGKCQDYDCTRLRSGGILEARG